MAELLALGVSHKTAPLDLRERLSLTEGRAVGALRELTAAAGIHEAAAISTCNRTELYLIVSDPVEAESTALGVLTRQAEIRPTELLGHLYSLRSVEAARHLLRVTAGLDSMIVGEAEIQGQVKRAYELALVEGAHRADPQPPLPRRPQPPAAAPARRPGSARRASRSPRSRSSWRGARSATSPTAACWSSAPARPPSWSPGPWSPAASAPSSSPTATTTARSGSPSASAAAPSASRSCPSSWPRPTSSSPRPTRPHHIVERDELAQVMASAPRAAAAGDRHRRPARHRARLPRDRRRQRPRHRRRPADRRTQRQRPRGRGAAGGADHRGRAGPLRALARLARGGADDQRPARARRRGRAAGAGRERGPLGEPLRGRPRAAGDDGEGDRLAPPARADPADAAARPAATRPTSTSAPCASCSASTSRPSRRPRAGANVTELRRKGKSA